MPLVGLRKILHMLIEMGSDALAASVLYLRKVAGISLESVHMQACARTHARTHTHAHTHTHN